MELTRSYESIYYCQQLTKVTGRRYNIRPDLDEETEPDVKGYVYEETTAGFFRAWELNEIHLGITAIVNEMRVAGIEQIIKKAGLGESKCLQTIEECVVKGLLCENHVIFKDEDDIYLYMVDTGGIFALEEACIDYQKLNYTTSIDQRLKIYRKNIYLVENEKQLKGKAVNLYFFEDILGLGQYEKYYSGTLLIDMDIAAKMGLTDQVQVEINDIVQKTNAMIFDTSQKKYIDIKKLSV